VRCKHAHTHTRWLHLCVRWYDVEGRAQRAPLRDGKCRCERKVRVGKATLVVGEGGKV